jgi:hypothetical protein
MTQRGPHAALLECSVNRAPRNDVKMPTNASSGAGRISRDFHFCAASIGLVYIERAIPANAKLKRR